MTTIIIKHFDRFKHLDEVQIGRRLAEALNNVPRKEAFLWLCRNFTGYTMNSMGEIGWSQKGLYFGITYNHEEHRFFFYI